MDATLSIRSGGKRTPIVLSTISSFGSHPINLSLQFEFKFKSLNEFNPTYGSGNLIIPHGNSPLYEKRIRISQHLIDYIMSRPEGEQITLVPFLKDDASQIFIWTADTGIKLPELSTSIDTHLCSNCSAPGCIPVINGIEHSKNSDVAIAAMYFHVYNRNTKNWSKLQTHEVLSKWISKLKLAEIQMPLPSLAWKTITLEGASSRYGLAFALFNMHCITEQNEIHHHGKHVCTLLPRCPLVEAYYDAEALEALTSNFIGYLEEIISDYFTVFFFTSKNARHGISLLSSIHPMSTKSNSNLIQRTITDNSEIVHETEYATYALPNQ
jgi:hypothetical protein